MNFVEVRDLRVTYLGRGEPSLQVDGLEIREGESVLVLGKSGSGKSTLVNVLNGVIPGLISARVEGEVSVFGRDPRRTPVHEMATLVGTLLQDPEAQVFHHLVRDEIAFGPENFALSRKEIEGRVEESARVTGVSHLLSRETSTLSGGELQRTVLASVLALQPRALILDEPTSSIDPEGTAEILGLLRSLRRTGMSMIIVEHKVERVLPYVDRVILVDGGRIALNVEKGRLMDHVEVLSGAGVEVPEYYHYLRNHGLSRPALSGYRKSKVSRVRGERVILSGKVMVKTRDGKPLVHTSFSLREGEVVALMGRNGAGKTTLLRAIMDLLDSRLRSEVTLSLMGKDISGTRYYERGSYIAYLPQNFDVMFVRRTVEDEIRSSSRNPEIYLRLFSLEQVRKDDPLTLSFGQRRRVAMASILGRGQRVALLDEPTSGQDWYHRENLGKELRELSGRGISILVVTHDSRFVDRFCDRVMVMDAGRIVMEGTPEEVFQRGVVTPPTEYLVEAGVWNPLDG
ncbi:ABC transporter ATP-binding protein [Metallosphaera javensis (ex Sakai et al. 2022)]|uniref:ABC transporter ATP-binding protein n=1 Tax=Metallosphaera javensis (ex Sakai et al. 2022) TaxID=2775498 RepID=UPI002586415F|nr:MAG: putative branched-chain amino acid transport ATP-binding protein LivG [Metallosphaera javensis (ex Sakai et al. 2022)]